MKKNWKKARWSNKKNKKQKESILLNLNSNKVRLKLKWKPHLKFQSVIELTTHWYKRYYEDNQKAFDLSVKQIKEYINLLK